MPLSYYIDNHRVGGLINTKRTERECNCEFVTKETAGFIQYPGAKLVGKRVFVRTKRAIAAGDELFVWCGKEIARSIFNY